jgi:hypothetical protein
MSEDINGNKLRPSPDIVQDPLCRYRYKYTSADGRYYILVTYVIGLDRISRALWSKYSVTDNNYHDEGNVTLDKDFDEI